MVDSAMKAKMYQSTDYLIELKLGNKALGCPQVYPHSGVPGVGSVKMMHV